MQELPPTYSDISNEVSIVSEKYLWVQLVKLVQITARETCSAQFKKKVVK